MPSKEAKIYQEKDFLRGTEGYLLTSSGCFPTIAQWTLYMLDLRLSRFVCELSYLISKLWYFAKVECLHLSSSKLTFGTEVFRTSLLGPSSRVFFFQFQLGFCHTVVIGSGIFQFSQDQVFVFSTHFAITSLVIFAQLSLYFALL